ncbi:PAS domain S-box protein [Nitrospinae bacterium AH_259_B05_G02_I21]|nr:PAS domain S-box protein [Nitrospinae bacterium AH_259_B05_G02_I21]
MQRAGRQPKRTRFDLVIVALVGILTFIEESGLLEKWPFGEVPFFLFALAIALIWFAYRRVQELKAEIVERQRAEEAFSKAHTELEQTKQYLESLIENSTDAIIATDQNGKVSLFNKGAEALSSYGREEIIGRQGPVLYEREEDAKAVMRQIHEGGGTISAFETAFRAKNGNIIPVLISPSMLYDEEGRETGTVGFSVEDGESVVIDRDNFAHLFDEDPKELIPLMRYLFERPRPAKEAPSGGEFRLRLIGQSQATIQSMQDEEIEIQTFPFKIGRRSRAVSAELFDDNDLMLEDRQPYNVSRNHCAIIQINEDIVVLDRGSQLGTSIANERIGGKVKRTSIQLEPGVHTLVLGRHGSPFTFTLVLE